jgi:hypothetical protein
MPMRKGSQKGECFFRAFHMAIEKKIQSYEIEHVENDTHWDDFKACEIPFGR